MSLDGRLRQGLVQAADQVNPDIEEDLMQVVAGARRRRTFQLVMAAGVAAAVIVGAAIVVPDMLSNENRPVPAGPGLAGESPSPTAEPGPVVEADLEAWLVKDDKLYSDGFHYEGTDDVGMAALKRIIGGDGALRVGGTSSEIPSGTEVRSLNIAEANATVDLSSEFFAAGDTDTVLRLRVAQVVYALTQFDEVESVMFKMDGKSVGTFAGLNLNNSQIRDTFEDLMPAITVATPGYGWEFSSTSGVIEGTANVFEANVSWRILDENGVEIANGFATATCGSGCRGTYSIEAQFREAIDNDQPGTVEVLQFSAENGEPMDIVSIPVTLIAD